jgi:hypothetical protein
MKRFEDILAQCIDDVKAGRSSTEDCLASHPGVRERLEPLLRLALDIGWPADFGPSPRFKVRARVWLMEQINAWEAVRRWRWPRYGDKMQLIPHRRFSMANIIVAIALALSALAGGTAYAAQASMPGDVLYPVKLRTEQAGMMLAGDDVARAERALDLAERRLKEMVALAEMQRWQDMELAVEKYDYALEMALARIQAVGDGAGPAENVSDLVAEATARYLSVLDRVRDMVPDEAREAIAHSRSISELGHFRALEALAQVRPTRAVEINAAAAQGRLNRAGAMAERGDIDELENALLQFEAMAEFAEEISRIARQLGREVTMVEELVAEATFVHMEQLVDVWERAPGQAQAAIRAAAANAMARHERAVQALEQRGAGTPASEVAPERTEEQERVRERVEQMLDDSIPPALNLPGGVSAGCGCRGCRR